MMDGYGYGYGMMGGGYGIIGLIFWILVLIGLVLLIKYLWKGSATRGDSAIEILKKRYASGEISKEEFEEKKKDMV
jgi:putative membrane protein